LSWIATESEDERKASEEERECFPADDARDLTDWRLMFQRRVSDIDNRVEVVREYDVTQLWREIRQTKGDIFVCLFELRFESGESDFLVHIDDRQTPLDEIELEFADRHPFVGHQATLATYV
jgi:hypothetical protein